MTRSLVAIVGRPDVGKSTLFNRLIGRRLSIVDSRPGVTRDRIYAPTEWNGREFVLIDTGGITDDTEEIIPRSMREQAEIAIEMADVIVFVVDAKTGLLSGDEDVAMMLRRSRKPVVLVVNKCDTQAVEDVARHDFYALGWPEVYPISAEHGRGTGDLLDAIVTALPSADPDPVPEPDKYSSGEAVARDFASADSAFDDSEFDDSADDEFAFDDFDFDDSAFDDAEDGGFADETEVAGASPLEADPDKEIRLAIVGRPNVGKSSLVNHLLREERAIVSDIPGTT
ncbi:MAG: GTP-binding protein, partial [Clostridiaceae bacterium]|nr:GTP-binding protein [Clostridiaceae bacterium]